MEFAIQAGLVEEVFAQVQVRYKILVEAMLQEFAMALGQAQAFELAKVGAVLGLFAELAPDP